MHLPGALPYPVFIIEPSVVQGHNFMKIENQKTKKFLYTVFPKGMVATVQ